MTNKSKEIVFKADTVTVANMVKANCIEQFLSLFPLFLTVKLRKSTVFMCQY